MLFEIQISCHVHKVSECGVFSLVCGSFLEGDRLAVLLVRMSTVIKMGYWTSRFWWWYVPELTVQENSITRKNEILGWVIPSSGYSEYINGHIHFSISVGEMWTGGDYWPTSIMRRLILLSVCRNLAQGVRLDYSFSKPPLSRVKPISKRGST